MDQPRAAPDESRRKAHHDAVKARVDRDVNAQLAVHADHTTTVEAEKVETVAGQDRDVRRARVLARVSQIFDYAFLVVYELLGIRLVQSLIGASGSAGFVRDLRAVANPLYAMFNGIVSSPSAGGFTLALPIVLAQIVYALFHLGVTRLLRLFAHRRTAL